MWHLKNIFTYNNKLYECKVLWNRIVKRIEFLIFNFFDNAYDCVRFTVGEWCDIIITHRKKKWKNICVNKNIDFYCYVIIIYSFDPIHTCWSTCSPCKPKERKKSPLTVNILPTWKKLTPQPHPQGKIQLDRSSPNVHYYPYNVSWSSHTFHKLMKNKFPQEDRTLTTKVLPMQ